MDPQTKRSADYIDYADFGFEDDPIAGLKGLFPRLARLYFPAKDAARN